jgi:ubiquinol-cytochrome c reductase cytochrome b subunit
MQLGACHVESPYIEIGQLTTVAYFTYFIALVSIISLLENSYAILSTNKK